MRTLGEQGHQSTAIEKRKDLAYDQAQEKQG